MTRLPLFLIRVLPCAIHVVVFRSSSKEIKAVIIKSRKTFKERQRGGEEGKKESIEFRRARDRMNSPVLPGLPSYFSVTTMNLVPFLIR